MNRQQQSFRNNPPQTGGPRGSIGGGINMPPPYRAPPPGLIPTNNTQHPPPPPKGSSLPYSRFNVSEPNIGQYKSSPVSYRHTINHENSSTVQTNLKQMLSMPKHQTLDMNGQNTAIQHLRMQVCSIRRQSILLEWKL